MKLGSFITKLKVLRPTTPLSPFLSPSLVPSTVLLSPSYRFLRPRSVDIVYGRRLWWDQGDSSRSIDLGKERKVRLSDDEVPFCREFTSGRAEESSDPSSFP